MDCGKALTLPRDIPWQKFALTPDMFDTDYENLDLPPRWRSSLTAFYYTVPEEETADLYPDSRIVYLRVVASITGYNFEESLLADEFLEDYVAELVESDVIDPFESSILEKITGTLSFYSACEGAILQVGVFPHHTEKDVEIQDYPFVRDIEPKKREVYETKSQTGEMLSGSANNLNLSNGMTTSSSLEESDLLTGVDVETSAMWGIAEANVAVTGEWGTRRHTGEQTSNLTTTDNSRERRETQSFTTNLTQMYQPLLSYHIGTNRALWSISPRPHTVDSEFNLIRPRLGELGMAEDGAQVGRKLEGIQDAFLVVEVPKDRKGLCIQVALDTGHDVPDHLDPPHTFLVVMRRTIQACGKFDSSGDFKPDAPPPTWQQARAPTIVVTESRSEPPVMMYGKQLNDAQSKRELVCKANERSLYIMQRMITGFASRRYKPRPFVDTEAFGNAILSCLDASDYKLKDLGLTQSELKKLGELKIGSVGELFAARKTSKSADVLKAAEKISDRVIRIGTKIMEYESSKTKPATKKKKSPGRK